MGYHCSIVRTSPGQQHLIDEAELREAVGRMKGRLAVEDKDDELLVCQPELGDESEALFFVDGELWTSNPSESFFGLVNELAAHLDGRVRGDEGESYTADGREYIHQDDWPQHRADPPKPPARWWARPHVLYKLFVLLLACVVAAQFVHKRLAAGA